jgi:hypothetical protein
VAAADLSDRELRLLRMRAPRLLPGREARRVAAAAAAALAIQAQEVPAATLALRVRTRELTAATVRRQATRKAVARTWLMRNTLFLFATRDLAWMRPLLARRPLVPAMRRLDQEGLPATKVERVLEGLASRLSAGPLPRSEAIGLIRSHGVERGEDNQRVYWLLHAAALRGVFVIRPALDREQTFVAAPPDERLDRDQGLARLARRYLRAHGPASAEDFAAWGKLTKSEARAGWEQLGRTVELETGRSRLTALPGTLDPPEDERPVVRLLGAYDHYLLGWKGRALTVPPEHEPSVHPGAGYIRATAFADGLAFGTWRLERRGASIAVVVEPFGRLPAGALPGLEREAADLGRFFEAEAELRVQRTTR